MASLKIRVLAQQLALAVQHRNNGYLSISSMSMGLIKNGMHVLTGFFSTTDEAAELVSLLNIAASDDGEAVNIRAGIQDKSAEGYQERYEQALKLKSSVDFYLPIFDLFSEYADRIGDADLQTKVRRYRNSLISYIFNYNGIPLKALYDLFSDPKLRSPLDRLHTVGTSYLPGFIFNIKTTLMSLSRKDVEHIQSVLRCFSKIEFSKHNMLTENACYELLQALEHLKNIDREDDEKPIKQQALIDLVAAVFPQLQKSVVSSMLGMLLGFCRNLTLDEDQKRTLAKNISRLLHAGVTVTVPETDMKIDKIEWLKGHGDDVTSGEVIAYAVAPIDVERYKLGSVQCGEDLGSHKVPTADEVVYEDTHCIKVPIHARQSGKLQREEADAAEWVSGGNIATIKSNKSFIADTLPKLLGEMAKMTQGSEIAAIKYAFSDMMAQENTIDRIQKGVNLAYRISHLDKENTKAIKDLIGIYLDSKDIPKLNQLFDFAEMLNKDFKGNADLINKAIADLFALSAKEYSLESFNQYHQVLSNIPKDALLLFSHPFFSLPESVANTIKKVNRFASVDHETVEGIVAIVGKIKASKFDSAHNTQESALAIFNAMSDVGSDKLEKGLHELFPETISGFNYCVNDGDIVDVDTVVAEYTVNSDKYFIKSGFKGQFIMPESRDAYTPLCIIGEIKPDQEAADIDVIGKSIFIPSIYPFKIALMRLIRIAQISGGCRDAESALQRQGALKTLGKLADAWKVACQACKDDMSNITVMAIRHTFNFSNKVRVAKNIFLLMSVISITLAICGSVLAIPAAIMIGVSCIWLIVVLIYDTVRLRNSAHILFKHMKELLEKEEGIDDFEHKIKVIEALAAPNLAAGKLNKAADMLLKRSKRAAFTSVITGMFNTLVSKFSLRLDKLTNDPTLASEVLKTNDVSPVKPIETDIATVANSEHLSPY